MSATADQNQIIVSALMDGREEILRAGDPVVRPDETASIVILGDIALAGGVGKAIAQYGPGYPFAHCPAHLFSADLVCINLECCLSKRGGLVEPKPVPLVGDPSYIEAIPAAAQLVANCANNHFLDMGWAAALDSVATLGRAGIRYCGLAGDHIEPQPLICHTRAGTVGILGFASAAHPLLGEARINVALSSPSAVCEAIRTARRAVNLVVVLFHHGVEYCHYPLASDRRLCHLAVESGAGLVVCHHPHVLQGIETHGGTMIFHSIGNFLMDVPADKRPAAARTIGVRVRFARDRILGVTVEPYEISPGLQPTPVVGDDRVGLLHRLGKLSAALHNPYLARVRMAQARALRLQRRLCSLATMQRQVGWRQTMRYCWSRVSAGIAS